MVQNLIHQYNLLPHPEGGYFKETYRSTEIIPASGLPLRFPAERTFSTSIYFLLLKDLFSAFHRIKSDECWHFYEGQSLLIHVLDPGGCLQTITLGPGKESVYQYVVPAGCWFASEPAKGTTYSFVGCTVSPGFDFADFELAGKEKLSAAYPDLREIINRLCR